MEKWILRGDLIDEARRRRGYSWVTLVNAASFSDSWLRGARKGQAVEKELAEELATLLGVSLEDLGQRTIAFLSYEEMYPLVGLWTEKARERDDDVAFQDWIMREGAEANNPVAYLWAAASGSSISAGVQSGEDGPVLRVEFENCISPHPSDVAIHPTGMLARKTKPNQRYLTFEARSVEEDAEQQTEIGPLLQSHASVAVRVRDANLLQWVYRLAKSDSHSVAILTGSPTTFGVDLKPDDEQRRWMKLFGEHRPVEGPDFSVITTVVFEVGRGFPGHRPGQGKGVVEIGKLFLREKLPDGVELL